MSNEMKISKLDRIFLINQLKILEALYPDEAEALGVRREVLERGYEMLYAWDYEYVYDGEDTMSVEESQEVWDTLDMFDAIQRSMPEGFDTKPYPIAKFAGYDGNSEGKFLSFAQFTVERLRRFEYVPMQKHGYWNSHSPIRAAYRRMLAEWQKIERHERFSMSTDELTRVLAAAIHPEMREA